MTRSSISIFLLVVGSLWAAVVFWFFVMAGGIGQSNFAYISKMLLFFSWLFIGPLLLIVGAVLLLGTHQKMGSILSLIGCAILTVMVGYQAIASVHNLSDPLIAKFYSYYALNAIAVVLTLLSDAGALKLYRLTVMAARRSL
jgi:hypothetical protein